MKKVFTRSLALLSLFALKANANEPNQKTISFQENKGQICDQNFRPRTDVVFSTTFKNLTCHFKQTGLSYQIHNFTGYSEEKVGTRDGLTKAPKIISIYRVDINWLGSNQNVQIKKNKPLSDYNNYFLQQCPNGALNVKSFDEVVYKNIYNGIDLKYYSNGGVFEYDFIVAKGKDYKQIKFEVNGADEISVNILGDLVIKTKQGIINEKAPIAFQNGKSIPATRKVKDNVITFDVKNYSKDYELIIDPVVRLWGTYLGGSGNDVIDGAVKDAAGNLYTSGYTNSTGTVIATTGSHQTTLGGGYDAFFTKFNNSGVRQFGTFYGGAQNDYALSASIDGAGNSIYFSGYTTSTAGISTVGSHQSVLTGTNDAFLVKFNSAGVRQWGTYYGGSSNDYGEAVSVDGTGNVYLFGTTSSPTSTLIASAGAFQTTYGGGVSDAFMVKFSALGVRQWGTYYGTSLIDNGMGCVADATGNIFVCGKTQGASNPTFYGTAGVHQPTWTASDDAYLSKFSSTGTRLWSTYYGGNFNEQGSSCTLDASGNIYMAGWTGAAAVGTPSYIATPGCHQGTAAGGTWDGFLVKMSPTGTRIWGTYYGGLGNDYIYDTRTDATGNVYVAGYTSSGNQIAAPGAHQPTIGGLDDAFLVQFNSAGNRIYGTYYGGTGNDYGNNCVPDGSTGIYLLGVTDSNTGTIIATPGSHQSSSGGLDDGFVAKFFSCPSLTMSVSGPSVVCIGNSAILSSSSSTFTSYSWNTGPTTPSISITPTVTTNYTLTGIYTSGTVNCLYTDAHTVSVSALPSLTISSTQASTMCSGSPNPTLTALGATTYSWSTSSTTNTTAITPTATTSYTLTGANIYGCSTSLVYTQTVIPTPTITIVYTPSPACAGSPATLTASGASTYTWSSGPQTPSTTYTINSNPTFNVFLVNGSNSGCNAGKTITITPAASPNVTLTASQTTMCAGSTTTLTATGATIYNWNPGSLSGTSVAVSPTTTTTYSVIGTNTAGCTNTKTITVTVSPCTGISEISNTSSQLLVYPNPNNGEFRLIVPEYGTYTIINSIGQTIQSIEINENSEALSIKDLADGIYYLIGKSAKVKIVVSK